MFQNKILLLLLLVFTGRSLSGQEIVIAEGDVLQRTLEANTDLKISEADFLQARAEYRQTRAVFLPSITASHTGFTTTNPLMVFGSKLNQQIVQASDFDPDLLNDPERIDNFATRLEVYQPVIQISGLHQRRAARLKMEATALERERNRDYLALEAHKAYMQLQLAYRGVEVVEKALEAALANERTARDSYEQGLLQKADLLAASVRVGEIRNQLQNARTQVANASDYLGFLMNTQTTEVYRPADPLKKSEIAPSPPQTIPEAREDLQAARLATEARMQAFKAEKWAFLPTLNAFGTYELYDDAPFQFGASGYTLGAQLSWNILEGAGRMARAEQSRAAYEKSQLEWEQYRHRSELELARARRSFEDARLELEVTESGLAQREEALRILTNRYREGLEKTADLLVAETRYAEKELEYFQTLFEYNYALAYLEFLSKGNSIQN
mgnify:CR=1 FL=1